MFFRITLWFLILFSDFSGENWMVQFRCSAESCIPLTLCDFLSIYGGHQKVVSYQYTPKGCAPVLAVLAVMYIFCLLLDYFYFPLWKLFVLVVFTKVQQDQAFPSHVHRYAIYLCSLDDDNLVWQPTKSGDVYQWLLFLSACPTLDVPWPGRTPQLRDRLSFLRYMQRLMIDLTLQMLIQLKSDFSNAI